MAFFDKVHEPAEVLDLADGRLMLSRATNGDKVAVANVGGDYHAINDRCPHLGCSLSKARLERTTLTCHCHGSQYDIRTGEMLRGPTKHGAAAYDVDVADGTVTIRPKAASAVA